MAKRTARRGGLALLPSLADPNREAVISLLVRGAAALAALRAKVEVRRP